MKSKYLGFLGLLGLMGFEDPWYFLFFLFFLFPACSAMRSIAGRFLVGNKNPGAEKLDEFNKARAEEVGQHKAKILELLGQKGKIRNNDVEVLVSVSDATAERYLNELEKEGKIRQVREGSASYYEATK